MNWILRLLGIEKDTKYFVSFKLYKNDTHTDSGHCHITWKGQFDLGAIEKLILIGSQADREGFTNVVITCITKL